MIINIAKQDFEVTYVESLSGVELEDNKFFTFDCETTGLHIKKDKPFLAAICTGNKVYVFPPTVDNLLIMSLLSKTVKGVYGHNIKYDMHMVSNAGFDPLLITNWKDTMCLARLSLESVSSRDGGDNLGLKELSVNYIDSKSNRFEKDVKLELQALARQGEKVLSALLKPFPHPEKGSWTAAKVKQALKDEEPLPDRVEEVYDNWRSVYPEPNYSHVSLDKMIPYLAVDVILTRLFVLKSLPVVCHKKQVPVMEREFKLIPVMYKMERAGVRVDREYLEQSLVALKNQVVKLYDELRRLGFHLSVNQNIEIKKWYADRLGFEPPSMDKKFLNKQISKGDRVAELINRIRRFEKWRATYVKRMLEESEYDGRFYTQLNPHGAVSGRFSCNLQQMPKDPIYTEEGYEYEKQHPGHKVPKEYILYHPRRAFVPTGNGLNYLFFQDFSQVELRVTADYTLHFGGDVNMLRAYCPYRCFHYETGEEYGLETPEQANRWNELKPGCDVSQYKDMEHVFKAGWSVWITEENKPWVPTDVHMATTLKALVAMGYNPEEMSEDDLQWWRKKGKTFNFGRNYGMGDTHAAETLEIELEQAKALNKGYSDAFPLVVVYQQAVIDTMRNQGYCEHALGRRYYVSNSYKHYKVANYMVQGLCADDLKAKMISIDEFLVENNCKSKMILCIHDELVFEIHEDEQWIVPETVRIMQETPYVKVPIIAEVEYTDSSWDAKKRWA